MDVCGEGPNVAGDDKPLTAADATVVIFPSGAAERELLSPASRLALQDDFDARGFGVQGCISAKAPSLARSPL